MKILFIDRDGTIIFEPADGKIDSMEKLKILPNAVESLQKLSSNGYELIMVTNQPGLGTAKFSREKFDLPHQKLMETLKNNGINFKYVYICPHELEDNCNCRKPKTGLVDDFLRHNQINMDNSYFIGDRDTDIKMAKKIGCKSILYSSIGSANADFASNDWSKITNWILNNEKI